jgi:hypothetical protein
MRATAKAMEEGFVLDNIKGRRLFVMEGAKPGIFATAPDKLHATADQLGKRYPAAELFEETGRKGHPVISPPPAMCREEQLAPLALRATGRQSLIAAFQPARGMLARQGR